MDWFSRCCAPASNAGMEVKSSQDEEQGGLSVLHLCILCSPRFLFAVPPSVRLNLDGPRHLARCEALHPLPYRFISRVGSAADADASRIPNLNEQSEQQWAAHQRRHADRPLRRTSLYQSPLLFIPLSCSMRTARFV